MKNKILKMISRIVLVLMIICICSVDSKGTIIPMVGIMVCAAWLTIYYYLHEDESLDEK